MNKLHHFRFSASPLTAAIITILSLSVTASVRSDDEKPAARESESAQVKPNGGKPENSREIPREIPREGRPEREEANPQNREHPQPPAGRERDRPAPPRGEGPQRENQGSREDREHGPAGRPEQRKEGGERPPHPGKMELESRFRHLQEAAELLAISGLHEVSRHVLERAEELEREVHAEREAHARNSTAPEGLQREMQELRRQVEELRAEVARLRESRQPDRP